MCEAPLDYTAVSRTSGFASARFNDKDYLDGAINTVVSGQNTTMLHMDPTYIKLFSDNAGLAKKLGFEKSLRRCLAVHAPFRRKFKTITAMMRLRRICLKPTRAGF